MPQQDQVIGLVEATDDHAEIVAISGSGAAFCLRSFATPGGAVLSYGTGPDASTAKANCSSTPWSETATAFPTFASLCDDVDDQTIFVCRAVQNVLRQILGQQTTG